MLFRPILYVETSHVQRRNYSKYFIIAKIRMHFMWFSICLTKRLARGSILNRFERLLYSTKTALRVMKAKEPFLAPYRRVITADGQPTIRFGFRSRPVTGSGVLTAHLLWVVVTTVFTHLEVRKARLALIKGVARPGVGHRPWVPRRADG